MTAWAAISTVPSSVATPSFAASSGYIIAYQGGNGNPQALEMLSPGSASWQEGPVPAVPGPLSAIASPINGPVVRMGGFIPSDGLADSGAVWSWEVGEASWTQRPTMPTTDGYTVGPVSTPGGTLYAITFYSGGYYNSACYTLAPGATGWTAIASIPAPTDGSGNVEDFYVTLPRSDSTLVSLATFDQYAFEYDPTSGSWSDFTPVPPAGCTTYAIDGSDTIWTISGSTLYKLTSGSTAWVNAAAAPTSDSTVLLATADSLYAVSDSTVYALVVPQTPNAPTLQSPANGQYESVSDGLTVTAVYNSTDLAPASARAIRVKSSGGAYNYLNASSGTLQSTVVWNPLVIQPGAVGSLSIPAAALSNGVTYAWSAADQESAGSLQGPFAPDFSFNTQAAPVVSISSPTGTTTTATPTVSWVVSSPVGASQISYQVRVFTAAQTAATGFDPGTSAAVWDSGVQSGAATSVIVGTSLENGIYYVFYVQVTQTGPQTSQWVSVTSLVSYETPAAPTVSAAGTTLASGLPAVEITVNCHDNLFSAASASFESGVGSWAAVGNCTAATSTTYALDGTHSLAMARSATGSAATTQCAASGIAYESAPYTVMVSLCADSTSAGKTYTVEVVQEFTPVQQTVTLGAAGVWSTVTIPIVTEPNQGSIVLSVSDDPASATAGQTVYIDEAGVFPGTVSQWTAGGFAGIQELAVLRSDGLYVRGASAGTPGSPGVSGQTLVLYDAEVIPGTEYTYTATETVTLSVGDLIMSSSAPSDAAFVPAGAGWWEFDPTDLSTAVHAQMTDYQVDVTEQATAHTVLGQVTPNVIASVMGGVDGTATFETFDTATYKKLTDLLLSQKTVFVSDPFGDNQGVTYVRFGPETGGMSTGNGLRAKSAQLKPSTPGASHHTLTVTWVAQPRPSV